MSSTNNVYDEWRKITYNFDPAEKLEPKLSGEILSNSTVVSILKELSVELNNCVGIGTDGHTVTCHVLFILSAQITNFDDYCHFKSLSGG